MTARQNTNDILTALSFKNFVADFISKNGVKVVEDGFTTEVKKEIQAMIIGFEEEYQRQRLNSSNVLSTLNITVHYSSELDESGVARAIKKLMSINGQTPGLPTYRIQSITPMNASVFYSTESTMGQVNGQVTIQFIYLMEL